MEPEMPQAYKHEVRKARKDHKCCECQGTIKRGEKYHHHSGIWEGEPSTFKVCDDCEILRSLADENTTRWEVTPFGYLHETVEEKWRNSPEFLVQFVYIKLQRGASVPVWMNHKVNSLTKEPHEPFLSV